MTLGGSELALRAVGVQPSPNRTTTWFSDHILLPPLWHTTTLDSPPVTYQRSGQAHHFHPFATEKAADTFRIVVFGGSAAHGYGVLEPGAFPHRLEQILQRRAIDQEIQVINLGTIAWSSQQIAWAAKEVFALGGWDLVIIYSGHNELLELSSWKTYMEPGEHRRYTKVLLWNQRLQALRLYTVARKLLGKAEPPALGSADPPDVSGPDEQGIVGGHEEEATALQPGQDPVAVTPAMRLDDMNPLPRHERARIGPAERDYAARTYTHNISRVVAMARAAGTPVLMMAPAPNDNHDPAWFPYPEPTEGVFVACLEEAERIRGGDGSVEAAQACLELHPDDPRAHYGLANAMEAKGLRAEAVEHLIEARRWAEYPNRVVPEVSAAIRAFEGRPGVVGVLDIEALFRERSDGGLITYDLVYDHCHPSAPANWLIAGEVAKLLYDEGVLNGSDRDTIDAEAEAGFQDVQGRRTPDPRLEEWTGLTWIAGQTTPQYIADFQGDWQNILAAQQEAIESPEATPMDWLWAGNGHFYAYEIEAAVDAWRQAQRLDLTLCLAHGNMAHGLRLVGDRAGARKAAAKAVACDPSNEEFGAELALLEARSR
jgi:tetratricopeptide (TPR) repeat protein